MAKLSFLSGGGTSFHGTVIRTSVATLRRILGDPQSEENDGSDKVNFDWTCETNTGDVFTIYDWKEYRKISEDEIIEFHIGAKDDYTCSVAVTELHSLL